MPAECSLVDALQAAQDGNASGECADLGGPVRGPYTIVLDPADNPYTLTSVNNDSDGPDGLPAIIGQVTVESASATTNAVIERSTAAGTPAFRFFMVGGPEGAGASVPGAEIQSALNPRVLEPVPTAATLTLEHITLEDGVAQGGNGADCGGGGAGLGGAIFSHGGDVVLVDSVLDGNLALGGTGASAFVSCVGGGGGMGGKGGNGGVDRYGGGGGGGGLGGDGGSGGAAVVTADSSGGGGGGVGADGVPGNVGGSGGAGGVPGGGSGGSASGGSCNLGSPGTYGGGGGGGCGSLIGAIVAFGGDGGFGGGGGGGFGSGGFGSGGFGGGGGGTGDIGGAGGFGGGGGGSAGGSAFAAPGTSPSAFGGGEGSTGQFGGSGAGMGGAIFVLGGSLTVTGSTFAGNTAFGGPGLGGGGVGSGAGYGGAIFVDARDNGATGYSASGTTFASTNSAGSSGSGVYLYQTGLEVSTSSLAVGTVGASYFQALTASGGTAPYTWHVGGLPPGLSLTVSGTTYAITGTPAGLGTSSVLLEVTDSTSATAGNILNLDVANRGGTTTTLTSSANTADAGQRVTYTATVRGSGTPTGTVAFDGASGSSISGCSAQRLDSGTATCAVTYTASGSPTITAVYSGDSNFDPSTSAPLDQRVNPAPAVATPSLPAATEGTGYAQALSATGGTAPYTWTATGLPAGLSVDASTGVISGTPTVSGSFPAVDVTATDHVSQVATATLSLTVNPPPPALTGISPNSGPVGQPVTVTGSGFGDHAQTVGDAVYFTDRNHTLVKQDGGAITRWASGTVTTTVPGGLAAGSVSVAVYSGTGGLSGNTEPFTLTVLSVATGSLPAATGAVSGGGGGGGAFSHAPVVSGVSPGSGPAAGGSAVTISGARFTGATAVAFGGTAATAFTVDSDAQITATPPPGSGAVDVTVTTPYGTSSTTPADRYTYTAPTAEVAPAAPPTAPTFSDVPASYWARASIEALAARGIVSGFQGGTFRPNSPVTRAQFVKMLDLTLGLTVPASPAATSFTDVPASAWYAPYVAAAVKAGIVEGTSPTTFSPGAPVTREDLAVLVARALKLSRTAPLHFTDDGRIAAWALRGVGEAVAAGYINGFPNGSFQPLGTTTRAQAAKVMALVLRNRGS